MCGKDVTTLPWWWLRETFFCWTGNNEVARERWLEWWSFRGWWAKQGGYRLGLEVKNRGVPVRNRGEIEVFEENRKKKKGVGYTSFLIFKGLSESWGEWKRGKHVSTGEEKQSKGRRKWKQDNSGVYEWAFQVKPLQASCLWFLHSFISISNYISSYFIGLYSLHACSIFSLVFFMFVFSCECLMPYSFPELDT